MIICSGKDSCKQTTTSNSEMILCNGLNSCSSSQITNTNTLFMLGRFSGANTTIISPVNDNSVEIYFYGLKSGINATVFCSKNSTCYIYSSDTATNKYYNTNIICQRKCIIDCYSHASVQDCFHVQLTNDTFSQVSYVSENPTSAPTSTPTNAPTREPSQTPTSVPTLTPTKDPTNAPTPNPTDSPTSAPTEQPTNAPTGQPVIAYAIVGTLECVVDSDDITDDDGCSIDTDEELELCCGFERR